MASIEYQGIKFSGGKFFIILSLLGAIVGGGWSAYKFYDDYLDMKAQIQNFVAPDLSDFDKKIALVEQELEIIKTEIPMILEEVSLVASTAKELKDDLKADLRQMEGDIRHITEIVNDVEDRQKEDARELLDEMKLLEGSLDLKIDKALNNPLNNMSATVK